VTTLERSLEQRQHALLRANEIRTYRAEKKKQVKAGELPADWFLAQGPHDPQLRSMKVEAALVSIPGMGRTKAAGILRAAGVSPSKTLGGISEPAWERLYIVLESSRTMRKRLSVRGGSIPSC
jgi:hypothetical protein